MRVMAFDLSSSCVGVIAAEIVDNKIKTIKSCPIIPEAFDPTDLGYMKSKKKMPLSNGKGVVNSYWKKGEETITKAEKERRDKEVRAKKDICVIEKISHTMQTLITGVKPDLILVEKNAAFNGILTTILLAKVMGALLGVAGANGIPVEEYSVATVRKDLKIPVLVEEFTKGRTKEELMQVPDITKRALRHKMAEIYKVDFQTDDESDACVVFHYWYTKERR